MISTIVRVYRHRKAPPSTLIGVVEAVGTDERLAFHDKDELWEILQMLSSKEEKEQSKEQH